jgi:hypothetical protein
VTVTSVRFAILGDYTGAGHADLAVFRRVNAGLADTFISGGVTPPGGSSDFGSGTLDIPFQGDIDGDGKTDLILYRPSTQTWYVQGSSSGFQTYRFGGPGDIPVVGDFDGVGHAELAVYRPSTGQWFVAGHAGVYDTFGGPDDFPVPLVNYYGTGKDALVVYRPATAQWFVAGQSGGIAFGAPGDIPVPGDYYGMGRDVLAVYRPSTSQWFIGGQAAGISFGGTGDIPIAEDFLGIGRDEIGVYRPSTGQWFIAGLGGAYATFGGPNDIPLAAPYTYLALPGSAGSIISASSVGSLDFGVNALSLSATSGSPGVTVDSSKPLAAPAASYAVATPSTKASSTGNQVASSSSTQGSRPNQAAATPQDILHDYALASLKVIRKRAKGSRLGRA